MTKPPAPSLKCNVTTCDLDPGLCEIAAEGGYEKGGAHTFEKRGPPRSFKFPLPGYPEAAAMYQIIQSRRYPDGRGYMRNLRNGVRGVADRWWWMRSDNCGRPDLRDTPLSRNGGNAPHTAEVEHAVPVRVTSPFYHSIRPGDFGRLTNEQLSFPSRLFAVASSGRHYTQEPITDLEAQVPRGRNTTNPPMSNHFFLQELNRANALPAGLPRVSDNSPDLRTPSQRLFERLGSTTNPGDLVLLQNGVNAVKNNHENFKRPMAAQRLGRYMTSALQGDELSIRAVMSPLREVS